MPEHISIPITSWIVAFGVGIFATMLARFFGRKFRIVDNPDGVRKVHKEPIPITGGYAILVTILVVLTGLYAVFPHFRTIVDTSNHSILLLLGGALTAFAMGVYDDLYDLRPRSKLFFQIIAALFAYYAGFRVQGFTGPFGDSIQLDWMALPITIFWFLGCMNAINLLDGLDGLAGGVGFFVSMTLGLIGIIYGNMLIIILAATLCGATLAFLLFNFNPASIFLGDGGSMLIGFYIAAMSLVHNNKAETTVALAIPFIALGLPVFDTAMAILRRWSQRIPMGAGDRKHLHHVLIELGLSQRKAVVVLYTICITLGGAALLLTAGRNLMAAGILIVVGVAGFVAIRYMGMLSFKQLKGRVVEDLEERSLSSKASTEVEKSIQRMSNADNLMAVWNALAPAFEKLDLHHARFELGDDAGPGAKLEWIPNMSNSTDTVTMIHLGGDDTAMDKWSLFLNVHQHGKSYGTLEVWRKGEEMPIRDTAMLINKLRHALGVDVYRLIEEPSPETAADTRYSSDRVPPESEPTTQS